MIQVDMRNTEYAGFWKRAAAYIIDTALTMFVGYAVGWVSGIAYLGITGSGHGLRYIGFIAGVVVCWLYWAVMESSPKQATLGKLALGIKVTTGAGNRPSFARASGRFFAKYLSGLILLVGFIMVAFTAKKQGLHDIMADCIVVNDNQHMTMAGSVPA